MYRSWYSMKLLPSYPNLLQRLAGRSYLVETKELRHIMTKRPSFDRSYQSKRDWYLKNKDAADTRRRHSILAGKWKGLNKRTYTGYCELCNNQFDRLDYHHWNDNTPSCGLWLCSGCHRLAEAIDKNVLDVVDAYLGLKSRVENDYNKLKLPYHAG